MNASQKAKGDLLEDAVQAIEAFIFSVTQGLREAPIAFERNKIVVFEGAKYEIDLLAKVEFGRELDTIFIFECKNWKKKVGRKEVTDFSEKIKILNAQYGFIISEQFTKDARARAKSDRRIKLVNVNREINITNIPIEFYSPTLLNSKLIIKGEIQNGSYSKDEIFELEGQKIKLKDLVNKLCLELQDEIHRTEPSLMLTVHTFEKEKIFNFDKGKLYFKDRPIESIKAKFKFKIDLVEPIIKSQFNIEKRGRYYTVEFYDPNNNITMTTSLAQLE